MTLAETPEQRAAIRAQTLKATRRTKSKHSHSWTPWNKPGQLGENQRRTCTTCGKIAVRWNTIHQPDG